MEGSSWVEHGREHACETLFVVVNSRCRLPHLLKCMTMHCILLGRPDGGHGRVSEGALHARAQQDDLQAREAANEASPRLQASRVEARADLRIDLARTVLDDEGVAVAGL